MKKDDVRKYMFVVRNQDSMCSSAKAFTLFYGICVSAQPIIIPADRTNVYYMQVLNLLNFKLEQWSVSRCTQVTSESPLYAKIQEVLNREHHRNPTLFQIAHEILSQKISNSF